MWGVRFLLILGGLSATYQPSLPIPRTAGTGAMARDRLTPRLPPQWLVAQGTLKQMPFLPARADPNNLLCGSFCLGTQQPPSVHSNVCEQLLPLVSTAMLPEHTLPPAATSTTSCGQTRLHPACSPWGASQASGSLLCLPAQTVGIQLLACAISHSPEPMGHMRGHLGIQRSPVPEVTPKERRTGWAHPPQVPRSQRGQGKTLRLSPLLAKQREQARHLTWW